MAEYMIQDTTLTAIANAIRAKAGTTDPITVGNFPAAIEALPEAAKFSTGFIRPDTNVSTMTISDLDHKCSNIVVVQGAAGTIATRCLHWFYALADGSGYVGYHNSSADDLEWEDSSDDAFPTVTYSDTSISIALGAYSTSGGQIYFQGTTNYFWIAW